MVRAWLLDCARRRLGLHVTHLVDGGDRVACTEQWHYRDGTKVLGVSTAGLQNGLITNQHDLGLGPGVGLGLIAAAKGYVGSSGGQAGPSKTGGEAAVRPAGSSGALTPVSGPGW